MSSSELMLSNFTRRPQGEPFSEIVFGERIDDPYRWMERADRASEVTDFIRQASEHTISQLAALPGRALLRERVAAGLRAGVRYGDLREAGGRLFYRRMDPDAQLAKLVTRDGEGLERVLYDPEAGGTPGAAINSYSVSPSGATVALHTAAGGSEVGAIRFIDVAGGDHLSDFLEPVWGQLEASWLDEHTVAYTRITATGAADPTLSMRACLRRLGGKDGPDLLGAETEGAPRFEPREWPIILLEDDGDWAIGLGVGARADARVFVARRTDLVAGRPAWREIAGYDDRVNAAALHGDVLYLATTREASNGEVVAIDLAITGTLAQARTVIHASEAIITELVAGADGIYVLAQTDGISRLFFLGMNEAPAELPLPIQGFAALLRRSRPGPGVTFALQDWFTAPRWFRASGTAISPLGVDSASYAGLQDARQIRETATSADGTQVPLAILLPPDHRPVPAPLLLVGYGSYGISTAEPHYAAWLFGLLESGGIVALCGTRGGGERGRDWHEAGRAASKPNAHADLISGGERLLELGLTRPEMMTVMGTSAGGLLAPPAAFLRPDLFGALVANVAVLNPTRLAAARNGPNQFAEMGDPGSEEGFRGLMAQDAYQQLATIRDMPDTLLTVGLNDHRVEPWMSSKFAARALERFGERRLVLIRADPEAGHGIGSALDQLIEELSDVYAFVLDRAGVAGFSRPRRLLPQRPGG